MKQTAVEWLIKKLQNREKGIFDGLPHLSLDEIYNKAKEMEKEQIMEANSVGYRDGIMYANGEDWMYQNPEHYYDETFGGNK